MQRFLLGFLLPIFMIASAHANVFVLTSPPAAQAQTPVITPSGNTPTFTQVGTSGPAVPADSTIALTCACATITGATVQITGGSFTNDALNFTNIFSITGSFGGTTMTLSGSDTVAHYQQALQSVTYSSTNADPTNAGSNPTRTISWIATSAAGSSNTGVSTLNVVLSQVAPVLSGGGNTVTFTSGGAAVAVDSGIGVSSAVNVTSATVSITSGLLALDTLNFSNQFSITGSYNAGAGVLTLSGSDTASHYQTAMSSVTYSSTAADPTNSGADVTRTVTWQGINGPNLSNTVTSTINVQNPAQPAISSVGNTVSYTAGGSAAVLDNAIIVSCTCATLTSATVQIAPGNPSGGFFTGDTLAATVGATNILASYNATTGVITLVGTGAGGTDTVTNFQTVMRTIAYSSSAGDPTNGGLNSTRTTSWVATNGTVSSSSVSTFVNVFTPGQPTWVNNGAAVAFNPGTQQCWVAGVGTGPISSCLQETRATQETCVNGATITYAAPNVLCATTAGIQVLPAYTNQVTQSNDQGNSGVWVHFTTGSGTVSATSNSAVAPDGTTTAAKVTVNRTSTSSFGDSASVINNTVGGIAGSASFSASIWLKADGVGDVGKSVNVYFLGATTNASIIYVLTSTWTEVPIDNLTAGTSGCVAASHTCQFTVGYTGASSLAQSGTVNIDTWGAEVNLGPEAFPTQPTTSAAANSAADNIIGLSQINTAMTGTASSIITSVSNAQASTVAEVVDSNGSALLEETATNFLTTLVGTQNTTTNQGIWTSSVIIGYARDSTGRTFALNNGVIVKDGASTSIGTPITFGSSNTGANPLTGNIGITNIYATRVADSVIGALGTGTKYYFANNGTCTPIAAGTSGSCSDSNPCTITLACNSITKVNTLNLVTNDQVNFNGGDTFVGCITFNAASNWGATRANPATFQSFGTGQATLTPNCANGGGNEGVTEIGIMNFTSTDGVTINNLKFLGDTAGNTAWGILFRGADRAASHGTILIQNNTFQGIHNGTGNGHTGADIGVDTGQNLTNFLVDHITILNNTAVGASPTATDFNFTSNVANSGACNSQYDAIQGNLVANKGGDNTVFTGGSGSGIIVMEACPPGSINGTVAQGIGATAQFNVVHTIGLNENRCGGPAPMWTYKSHGVIFRMNEAYDAYPAAGGSPCDYEAFELETGTSNSLYERNYGHNVWGSCYSDFVSGGSNTFRWNVCDETGNSTSGAALNSQGTGGPVWIYNNSANNGPLNSSHYVFNTSGTCPGAGSIFANNIVSQPHNANGLFEMVYLQNGGGGPCTIGASGLTMDNNYYYNASGAGGSYLFRNGTSTYSSLALWQASAGNPDPHSIASAVNPFSAAINQNATCNSTVGSPGPQASGCPASMTLVAGSAAAAPAGAVLTSAPFNLPTTIGGIANAYNGQGTLSYYGGTLPCTNSVNGGYPIGADCGTGGSVPPPPTITQTTTPSNNTTPLISGTGVATDQLSLSIDGNVVTTFAVPGTNNWSFQTTAPLGQGSHSATAIQTNASGTSPVSNTDTFVVNIVPPAPAITTPTSGQVFATQTPTIFGTGVTGNTINVSIDGTLQGTHPTVASGNWTFTTGTLTNNADHTVSATQTSVGGTSAACPANSACNVTFHITAGVVGSLHLDFTSGSLPAGTTFTGGANGSYYTAANVLHTPNAANSPRFDHNPANGAVLGILIEPAKTNFWASSNMTAGNVNGADQDHATFATNCLNGTQITISWCGVWGTVTESQATGPDNVANSAGSFVDDNCLFPTPNGQPVSPAGCSPNATGDGGHASANAVLPGNQGGSHFQAINQNVIVSVYAKVNPGTASNRILTFYAPDSNGNDCYLTVNLISGTLFSPPFSGTYPVCTNPIIQPINISGNLWYHVMYIEGTQGNVARVNLSDGVGSGVNQGDGVSGFRIYGLQITPISQTAICTPGVSGTVPCSAGSYISNSNVYTPPQATTADALVITTIPSGLNFLTYTFDDGTTQKQALGCSPNCTGLSNVPVPTNLNRPWIRLIDGSAS